jgi:peptidoglycan DL-endopeptidase LytE
MALSLAVPTSQHKESTPTADKAMAIADFHPVATPEAMFTALDVQLEMLARGQGEGVVAVRSTSSSRGGLRAPAPTPGPTAVASPGASPRPSVSPSPGASPTPGPSPTPTAAPKKEALKAQTYKVVSGDTLLGIAYKFGITPETILWANDLGNGDMLQIGDELTILPVSGVLHKVKKGDTFSTIAEAYGADPAKMVEANLLTDIHMLQEGQVLIVPGGMMRTTEPITGLPTAPSQQELAKAPKYIVKPGDTLLSIADDFGVRASVIQVANNLMDPDTLKIGQELAIPGGSAPVAAAPKPQTQATAPKPTPKPAPAPEPPAAPAPVSGEGGDRIAAISQQYLGYRYVWGGTSPSGGFDCSGFVWFVYKQAGISIPRAPLGSQVASGARVSRDQLLPGDLIFWANTYTAGLSHVGIYLGGGRFINAESEAVGVQIRSLNDPFWSARFYAASRPW